SKGWRHHLSSRSFLLSDDPRDPGGSRTPDTFNPRGSNMITTPKLSDAARALVAVTLAVFAALCTLPSRGQTNSSPSVTTDREDYPPFSYVDIRGIGFQPGETVSNQIMQVAGPDKGATYPPWNVVADTNGNFFTTWYVFTTDLAGGTFQLTSVGLSS